LTRARQRPNDFRSNWEAARALSRYANDPVRAKPFWERARQLGNPEVRERWPYRWAIAELYSATEYWIEGKPGQALTEIENAVAKFDSLDERPRRALAVEAAHQYLCLGRISNAKALTSLLSGEDRAHVGSMIALAGGPKHLPDGSKPHTVSLIALARGGYAAEVEAGLSDLRDFASFDSDLKIYFGVIEGELALARGDSNAGIRILEKSLNRYESLPFTSGFFAYFLGSQSLAQALMKRGDLIEATGVLEKVLGPEFANRRREGTWVNLNNRWQLAQIYRKLGRNDHYEELVKELEHLLQYADEDHPILLAMHEAENR
jgi:hypothetical protein